MEKKVRHSKRNKRFIIFFLIIVIGCFFFFPWVESNVVENVQMFQVKLKDDFSWLIDLGRLFMLMI